MVTYSDTENRILDVAQGLVQSRGFNAFSYRDLSNEIGIKTSSIHYHFPSKDDLGQALIARYREVFNARLAEIDRSAAAAREKLERYVSIFQEVMMERGRVCLCGMLASDFATLGEGAQGEVRRFYDDNEAWLAAVLESGTETDELHLNESPRTAAATLFAALEGVMIGANVYADPKRFERAGKALLDSLVGGR